MTDKDPRCEKCGKVAKIRMTIQEGDTVKYVCPECYESEVE